MEIRGRRECKACGARWSYYDTGEPACPECGSLYSVGVDEERSVHTATDGTLDLAPVRADIDAEPTRRLAERAAGHCREFTRGYGFIHAGELQPLGETYLAAMELKHVASELARRIETGDDETLYFTELLRADEGARPEPAEVPGSLRSMRGLAYAAAAKEYRSDLRTYLEEQPDEAVGGPIERLSEHTRRVRALDGDVAPQDAERLVRAARGIGRYLTDGDENALLEAETRLDGLA